MKNCRSFGCWCAKRGVKKVEESTWTLWKVYEKNIAQQDFMKSKKYLFTPSRWKNIQRETKRVHRAVILPTFSFRNSMISLAFGVLTRRAEEDTAVLYETKELSVARIKTISSTKRLLRDFISFLVTNNIVVDRKMSKIWNEISIILFYSKKKHKSFAAWKTGSSNLVIASLYHEEIG